MILVHTTGDVEEYAAAAEPFLRADPCGRNVLLTIIGIVRAAPGTYGGAPGTYGGAPSFWWVTNADAVIGAASWTPPHNLLVSSMPLAAVPDLAEAAVKRAEAVGLRPNGVVGPALPARAVAAAWTAITHDSIERDRTILLDGGAVLARRGAGSTRYPPFCPNRRRPVDRGVARDVQRGDRARRPANAHALAEHMVRSEQIDVWIADDQIVSMVGHRDAAGVVRVGPVYTPPEYRNHGYARRLTYEVTAAALQRPGVGHAMLFTDAANPVSNSIYRQAGYAPRGEHVEIDFAKRVVDPAA